MQTVVKTSDIVKAIGAKLVVPLSCADKDPEIKSLAAIDKAGKGDITFLSNAAYKKFVAETKATAIIVAEEFPALNVIQLVHKNPYLAFAKVAQLFLGAQRPEPSIHASAVIAASAKVGNGVTIFPQVYVGENAQIGDNVILYPGVYLGDNVAIGSDSTLHANVVIESGCKLGKRVLIHGGSVIGADGFGFVPDLEANKLEKIPQTGIVVIEDDVEIGGNSTIDRAAMGETRIGKGSKLDSAVHVGHNVVIGQNSMLCGQSAIAGSAKIGNWVIIAGLSGVNNHVEIADGVQLGAMSGMTKDAKEKGPYLGFPAMPAREWRKQEAYVRRIPQLVERIKELEEKISQIKP